jgi:tRNA (guanine37-N1)-methyltransferase
MDIHVITLFPEIIAGPLESSILKRAQEKGFIRVFLHNIRDFARDTHRTVDDYAFGGGPGMVMKPEPIFLAVEYVQESIRNTQRGSSKDPCEAPIILLSPQGDRFDQNTAKSLATSPNIILICGRYEGIDARVETHLASQTLSIGDYVLTGGEFPALVVIDALTRLIPGVLGSEASAPNDSFANSLLEGPQYTRPAVYRNISVPDILLSGNHLAISDWHHRQALLWTRERRPDLLDRDQLSEEDISFLKSLDDPEEH